MAAEKPSTPRPDAKPAGRPRKITRAALDRAVDRAYWAIVWERLWPALASVLTAVGFFIAVSWTGLWLVVPPLARAILLFSLLLVIAVSALPLFRFRLPRHGDALHRLDRASGLEHRPVTAIADELAIDRNDQVAQVLWQAHLERARRSMRAFKVGLPTPGLSARDPVAFRALVAVLLMATFFAAGGERGKRLLAAFDWAGVVPAANFRIDAWVTPPPYTGRPPLILPGVHAGEPPQAVEGLEVPVGSVLIVRATNSAGVEITTHGGLAETPREANATVPVGTDERRFTIQESGSATVRGALSDDLTWEFRAIPDRPPTIALVKDPEAQARGGLHLVYKLDDDYGVVSARAAFARKPADNPEGRALFGPPDFSLLLPQTRTRSGVGQTTKELADHAWAGAEVVMTLTARDEAGNEGSSAPRELRLPQRAFFKPLAKALVEQRRILAFDADARPRVMRALDALTIAPERFTPEAGIYLGLRAIYWQLDQARSDDDLREVVARLWAMATAIEDGNVSEAEQALRAAQDALRQALERGANDEEIKKLSEELRQALDKFLQALNEQMKNNPQQLARPLDPNARVLRPQDLKSMLDRIENLARSGAKDAARQLLQELQSMLDNLQMAQPGGQQDDDMSALDELGDMIHRQQQLRDRTFRQGQDSRRSERQQRGRRGQQGDQSQQGDRNQQNGFGELQQNQQALRDQLKKLLEELRKRGDLGQQRQRGQQGEDGQQAQPGQGMDEALGRAEEAMRDAEGALGEENAESAVDAQGRALEALRKGAQGMAQQMQQGPGGGPGQPGRNGPARAQQDTDPLGRPMRGHDLGDDLTVKIPGEIDVQRARRILDELRRRFADPERPKLELDYIERLLREF